MPLRKALDTLTGILGSDPYRKDLNTYRACGGCWMACFVEVILAMPKWYQTRIIKKMNKDWKKFV